VDLILGFALKKSAITGNDVHSLLALQPQNLFQKCYQFSIQVKTAGMEVPLQA
jgi:hypothetical protein